MNHPDALKNITDFSSLVAYLREELDWEIPDDLPLDKLTYNYTADELGLKLDAQVEITQLRPILGRENAWGVFFVDFDKAELPVTLLRRILSSVSRRKRASANPGDRALFDKNDLLFVSAFGKAEDRRLALAHFHQEPETAALPTLRVLTWDQQDTQRHMKTVAERLDRLRWPYGRELDEAWKARWAGAFVDRPREAIRTAKEMAQALAGCAKQIRSAIEEILPKEKPGQPLTQLFEAVKATLNKDLDVPKFADTYAQTIAYGLLSKRIDQVQRWRAEKARTLDGDLPLPPITADALETAIPTNPFLSELLTSFMGAVGRDAGGSALDFDELGLGDLVDLLNTANMEAVLDDFDKDKQGDDPVIHFYEGFLAAYDKAMKVQRGVFYTPKPVVSFIVRSVDEVLRTEFGLPLGLADTTTWGAFVKAHPQTKIPDGVKPEEPFVKILDPATGTGTFLVEVIDLIHRRMTEEAWKGKSADEKRRLWNAYVAEHLLPRLYGYELMMAPYAVAHMKIGLKLADTGYDFSGVETGPDGKTRPMRARVFLTNALEPAQDLDMQLAFMNEALAHEAKAANQTKARARFTVVVGNPPYSGISSNMGDWIRDLLRGQGEPSSTANYYAIEGVALGERKLWLQDDYVKFFRLAQYCINTSSRGVIGYITNHGFLHNPTFRAMRYALWRNFDNLWAIDLNGSTRRTDLSSDHADENVFDIETGVAVAFLSQNGRESGPVQYSSLLGTRFEKAKSLETADIEVNSAAPQPPHYFFSAELPENEYSDFVDLPSLLRSNVTGIVTARDAFVVDMDRTAVMARVSDLHQSNLTDDDLRKKYFLGKTGKYPAGDSRGWKLGEARRALRSDAQWRDRAQLVAYRPFDARWMYYTSYMVDWPRTDLMSHMRQNNPLGLISTRQRTQTGGTWSGVFVANRMVESTAISNRTSEINYLFPLWLSDIARAATPNLSQIGRAHV